MEKLEGYNSRIKRLSELVAQLESGELSLDELSEMEKITRELHERSIILRYNAFKEKPLGTSEEEEIEGVEVEVIIEEIEDDKIDVAVGTPEENELAFDLETNEEDEAEEEPAIDFDIFDENEAESEEEINEVEPVAQAVEETPIEEPAPEPIAETPREEAKIEETPTSDMVESEPVVSEPEPEPVAEAPVEEEIKEETASDSAQSFLDRLQVEDNSVASRFSQGKIDTLIGAFGLNQRLRYINDLFDGSSEIFSDAIKALDNQDSLNSANQKAAQLATEHDWDPEEEVVIEFMTYLNRRYA